MDYGRLIGRAWDLAWQHRFLWVLGLFAASTVGSCSAGTGGGGGVRWQTRAWEIGPIPPEGERALRALGLWATPNLQMILMGVAALLLLGVLFLAVSLISQGGMARATADLAMGRPISAGQAWQTGVSLLWRYLGLWLLLMGLFVVLSLVVAVFVGVGIGLSRIVTGPPRAILLLFEGLLGLGLAVVAVLLFIAIGVAAAFAQRSIAVENAGPLAALEIGFQVLRDHPGASALAWLINLGLAIAAGLAVIVALVAMLVLLGTLGVVLFVVTYLSAAFFLYLIVAALALVAFGWLLGGLTNSLFWSYWTLVYLNLTGRLDDRLEVPPPSPREEGGAAP